MANTFKNTQNTSANLVLAFGGQIFAEQDRASYIYPDQTNAKWMPQIEDMGRDLLNKLRIIKYPYGCISLWLSDSGVCYSICRRQPSRGGSDAAVVMLHSTHAATNGLLLKQKMQAILDYVTGIAEEGKAQTDIEEAKIKNWLGEVQDCFVGGRPVYREKSESVDTGDHFSARHALYEYDSDEELTELIPLFPFQRAAQNHDYIHLVRPAEQEQPGADQGIERITVKPQAVYFFTPVPSGVNVVGGLKYIDETGSFVLEYRKEGYEPLRTDPLTVDRDSHFFKVDKNIRSISVNAYNNGMGIRFTKKVRITVKDKSTDSLINNWSWYKEGDKNMKRPDDDGYIILSEGKHKIKILADNHDMSKPLEIDTDKSNQYSVQLQPTGFERNMTLVPAWGRHSKKELRPVMVSGEKTGTFYHYQEKHTESNERKKNPKFYITVTHPLVGMIATSILICALGFGIGKTDWKSLFGKAKTAAEIANSTSSIENAATEPTQIKQSSQSHNDPKSEEDLEKDDIAYLNRNVENWFFDSIHSWKYLYFIDAVVPNLINRDESILQNYSEITNNYWQTYVNYWEKGKKGRTNTDWRDFNQASKKINECKNQKGIDWTKVISNTPNPNQQGTPTQTRTNPTDNYGSM